MGNNTSQDKIPVMTLTPAINLDDRQHTTTKQLYTDAILYTDNSIAITENCITQVNSMLNISDTIHHSLEEQGQVISKLQDDCIYIQANAQHADRKLRSINSIWGALYNKITPSKTHTKPRQKSHSKSPPNKATSAKIHPSSNIRNTESLHIIHIEAIDTQDRVEQDKLEQDRLEQDKLEQDKLEDDKLEKELVSKNRIVDVNLDRLDAMMDTLCHSAIDMNSTLDEHNRQLARIDPFITKINKKIDTLSHKCDVITK